MFISIEIGHYGGHGLTFIILISYVVDCRGAHGLSLMLVTILIFRLCGRLVDLVHLYNLDLIVILVFVIVLVHLQVLVFLPMVFSLV